MAVSIVQAAMNALGCYLSRRFAAEGYSGATAVSVEPRWPDPDKALPPRAISIVTAGAREDVLFDPFVVSTSDNGDGTSTSLWAVASVDQPLQLDVWAGYDYVRDDLVARLDMFLRGGEGATLNLASDPFRQGVLVPLADGWTGNADVLFDGPDCRATPTSARQTEYRALYRGRASMLLTMPATNARIAHLTIRRRLREQDPASGPYDVITVTESGRTSSQS